MSEQAINVGYSKEVAKEEEDRRDKSNQGSEDAVAVLDQLIIIPEIMSLILERLDLRSLKTARLVCKSWLREAQAHLENRGIVRLYREHPDDTMIIDEFLEVRKTKIPSLPQPFQSIDVDTLFAAEWLYADEDILPQVSGLCPPLALTRFAPHKYPLSLTLPLIIQCSSTLEYLRLHAWDCETGYLPLMNPKQEFPNLRHLRIEASHFAKPDDTKKKIHFPAIVAWIVKASPNLDTYEYRSQNFEEVLELGSELLMAVDISNVKTLKLSSVTLPNKLSSAVLKHFDSIQFSQLEDLKMSIYTAPAPSWSNQALFTTMAKSAQTLRTLDLSYTERADYDSFRFPVFPNVHELTMTSAPSRNAFIQQLFPNLRILNVHQVGVVKGKERWGKIPPLAGLKTLRINKCNDFNLALDLNCEEPWKFFEKFPALERLGVHPSAIIKYCSLKSSGDPKFSKLLDSVKHLELCPSPEVPSFNGYSLLAVLKGLETITMTGFHEDILTIPVGELSDLRLIRFPWGDSWRTDEPYRRAEENLLPYLKKYLEMAKGVKKVVITSCCSYQRRVRDPRSKDVLDAFFEAAPNVECGCENWKKAPKCYTD